VSADFDNDGGLDVAVAAEGANGAPAGTISVFLSMNPTITNPCSYSLSPSGQAFSASGGLNSFTVTTTSACSWKAVPSASWITIGPGGSHGTAKVNYAVAANGGQSRTGTISIANQKYNIDQTGFSCTFNVSPTIASPSNAGGPVYISVSAPSGCAWTAAGGASWLTISSGASGSGNGVVVLNVASNPGAPRSGTATAAGTTISVTQGAGACGAVDVTSQAVPSRGRYTGFPPDPTLFQQYFTITNQTSSAISGPLNLVLEGLPTSTGAGLANGFGFTFCFRSTGDYIVPFAPGGLAARQSMTFSLDIVVPNFNPPSLSYTLKVLSGTPSK
jgi:hypothetical protein